MAIHNTRVTRLAMFGFSIMPHTLCVTLCVEYSMIGSMESTSACDNMGSKIVETTA